MIIKNTNKNTLHYHHNAHSFVHIPFIDNLCVKQSDKDVQPELTPVHHAALVKFFRRSWPSLHDKEKDETLNKTCYRH